MRILILEDEPLIAMDLEDIVQEATGADCLWARTLTEGMNLSEGRVDFALLDWDLFDATSLPVAEKLTARRIPFCFVTGNAAALPAHLRDVSCIRKPFRRLDIMHAVSDAGRLPIPA